MLLKDCAPASPGICCVVIGCNFSAASLLRRLLRQKPLASERRKGLPFL